MSIPRAVGVANGKGGVGKTSVATNLAGQLAAAGNRVLLVDLDPQNNTHKDLGYGPTDGGDLCAALYLGTPLPVVYGVRPRLDVVPSGSKLNDITAVAVTRASRGEPSLAHSLFSVLEPLAAQYDMVIVDTPPLIKEIQDAALGVVQYVVVPTKADEASLDGLPIVAERFRQARMVNPDLTLAGVVVFDIDRPQPTSGASTRGTPTGIASRVVRAIDQMVPGLPILGQIRHLGSAAVDARAQHLLYHELDQVASKPTRRDRLEAMRAWHSGEQDVDLRVSTKSVGNLAQDYTDLLNALLSRIAELEAPPADLLGPDDSMQVVEGIEPQEQSA